MATAAADERRRSSLGSGVTGLSETYSRARDAELSRLSCPGSALPHAMRAPGLLGAEADTRSPSSPRGLELGPQLGPDLGPDLSPDLSPRRGKAAPRLGEMLTEPLAFMKGLKVRSESKQ